jgi:hypothetical protein
MFEGFPDLRFTIEDVVAKGNKVVARYSSSGTHQGCLQALLQPENKLWSQEPPPTELLTAGLRKNGRIGMKLGLMQQWGLAPTPRSVTF